MKLQPHEIEIVGTWIMKDNKMTEDDNEHRISWLIENALEELKKGEGGWSTLYQDRCDQRLWNSRIRRAKCTAEAHVDWLSLSLDEVAGKYGLERFA